ncbi:MAG: hypothetical protein EXQ74_04950 [Thermoleophilia bacterium]|nr:hypothetical protein [Thermoleophilia bacterium]
MAEYTPGGGGVSAIGARDVRFRAVLSRWPVVGEPWAQALERRRIQAVEDVYVSPGAKVGANVAAQGITALQAINRALGLPDDDGVVPGVEQRPGNG